MRQIRPRTWLGLTVLSTVALGFTFFVGLSYIGLDVKEKCEKTHLQKFDGTYWSQHLEESGRFFPLQAKCNANYDLVPIWLNPALVIFALAAAVSIIAFIVSTTIRLTRKFRR